MKNAIKIFKQGLDKWVSIENVSRPDGIIERCAVEYLQKALAYMENVTVVSATINTIGRYDMGELPPQTDLPDFCDVRIQEKTQGGNIANIIVWLPLNWNQRFFGTGGGGNRIDINWSYMETFRVMTLPRAIQNGFAAAVSDGGNQDPRHFEWGLNEETKELDWELIKNLSYRSTHSMTVIGKAVTKAIYGTEPLYSYYQGASGGGRQGLTEAQRYPKDYDGIWAADSAINWSKFTMNCIWPFLVMKEYNNFLSYKKLDAFNDAVIAEFGNSNGFIETLDVPEFDPNKLVGKQTDDGIITETDATVMKKIWEGPRTSTDEFLWYGYRPGTITWGEDQRQFGAIKYMRTDDKDVPVVLPICKAYIGSWLLRDPDWDWTTLTVEQFEELFQLSVNEFTEISSDNPDLTAFRDNGGKLLLSHGVNDELIPSDGTIDYYNRVLKQMGGEEQVLPFLRLFYTPGNGHTNVTTNGPGLCIADGMIALMKWVEEGIEPDSIETVRYDFSAKKVISTNQVDIYRKNSSK